MLLLVLLLLLVLRIIIIGGKNNPRVKRWARGMEPHSGDHAVSQLCFRTPIAPSHVHLPLLLLPLLADNGTNLARVWFVESLRLGFGNLARVWFEPCYLVLLLLLPLLFATSHEPRKSAESRIRAREKR